MEPSLSLWDSGEWMTVNENLQVPHPPGAPFYQLLGRIFSLFAFGDAERIPLTQNAFSAVASAATIMFLFWTCTLLFRNIKMLNHHKSHTISAIMVFSSALLASLITAFSHTFWNSAIETEVYALASFLWLYSFGLYFIISMRLTKGKPLLGLLLSLIFSDCR